MNVFDNFSVSRTIINTYMYVVSFFFSVRGPKYCKEKQFSL